MKTTTPERIELVPVDRGGRTEYVWQNAKSPHPEAVRYVRETAAARPMPEVRRIKKRVAIINQSGKRAKRAEAIKRQAIKKRDEANADCLEMSRILHHTQEDLEAVKSAAAISRYEAAAEAIEKIASEHAHNERHPQYCMHCILVVRASEYRRAAEAKEQRRWDRVFGK